MAWGHLQCTQVRRRVSPTQDRKADRYVLGGPIQLDHTAGYSAEQWYDWIVTRLRDQTAVARCAYDEKQKAAERSRKAQAEADARRQQQSWQPRGSHPYGRSSYGGSFGSSYGSFSGRWR